jgi:LacI family transcriptional regulator
MHLKSLYGRRIDGIIVAPAYTADKKIRSENLHLYDGNIPTVFIDRKVENLHKMLIHSDNLNGSYVATNYLISRGHKNIGIIATKNFTTVNDRILGYKKALSENKLEFNENFIQMSNYEDDENIIKATENILKKRKITALMVLNDRLVGGVLLGIRNLNLVIPDDISVIAWDDSEITKLYDITVINQQVGKIGRLAMENLLQMINGTIEREENEIVLETELIERNTCRDITNRS